MKAIIILILIYICQSCVTIPDEELTMNRVPYIGNEIKISGYYFGYSRSDLQYCDYILFYSNGVMLSSTYKNDTKISTVFENFKKRTYKSDWALFQVNDSVISIQGWKSVTGPYNYILNNYQYKIINDSTLFYKYTNGDTTRYHFVRYFPKPDSTNVFIK